ncbi:MAG: sensor histidine kinase [Methanobacteriaceae archaeon]|nr:sensor histidine kinase [Methanobacteriaceae archaeon]
MSKKVKGLALFCDLNGDMENIIHDGLNLAHLIIKGKPFSSIFDEGSQKKAQEFVKEIKSKKWALEWELNLFDGKQIKVLHFSGFRSGKNILIIGSDSRDHLYSFFNELQEINTEQTKLMRRIVKEYSNYFEAANKLDYDLYQEIIRLNNELTNAQRELTKKNIELSELNKKNEMLLKEIHHRVKNNLMVISSLLNLQSRQIKDKGYLEIFKESQNRARSMALIHERLYQGSDLKRIDFSDYINTLAHELFNTYVKRPGSINLKINVKDVMLDTDIAVPLGLVVNELISNSLKHAFPDDKTGEVTITMEKDKDKYILIVSDDGVGLPPDMDYTRTKSLGLQLVHALTSQINGKVEINGSNGTTFKITFSE